MELTKPQETKVRNAAKLITKSLRQITQEQSFRFVMSTGNGSTLRALQSLQNAVESWNFKRSL